MNRLWTLVQDEHDAIWSLLDELTGGSGRPEGEIKAQREQARELVALQSAHEVAEELVFWPAARRLCEHGDDLVITALEQESEVKWALNELVHISPGSQEFRECVNTVAGLNRTHLSCEQNQIWPRLEDRLSSRDAALLARRWRGTRRRTPTRPHPHMPTHPAALGTVGLAAAAMDRVRDAVTGH
ncbi:hemerythrin domain-containing protein [Streptomyces sp. NPDC085995]|uniref:hemerythrin domain-containing protein n=1 Tax=Streptomyces sp. NPDC085995 TaxID=3154861 RepID=UPI00343A6A4A